MLSISLALVSSVRCVDVNYTAKAIALMKESPLIDTHIDLPQIIRSLRASLFPLISLPITCSLPDISYQIVDH
jgi:hypothetical protein